jgi:hypothetical protein
MPLIYFVPNRVVSFEKNVMLIAFKLIILLNKFFFLNSKDVLVVDKVD